MGVVRLHLHLIATLTVLAQLAMPALASAALCCDLSGPEYATVASDAMSECCDAEGAPACPLKNQHASHHEHDSDQGLRHAEHQDQGHHAPDGTVRSACEFDDQLFESLLGTTAVMPTPMSVTPPAVGLSDAARPTTGQPVWISPADLPPPKA